MRSTVFMAASISVALVAACSRSGGEAQPAPSSSAPKGTLALGERVTSQLVPLAEIARDPGRYRDHVVATSGRVTSVCREMGCWLELEDSSGRAHVKIHGHTFFVPRTAPGHVARVQAKVVKGTADDEDCEEQAAATDGGLAKVELLATGVEID
jgi:hypothetical protein